MPLVVLSVALPSRVQAQTQERVVQGTVRDSRGEALPGAGIRVKNTSIGTTADASGHYSITVPKGSDALLVNFVGLSPQELTIGSRSELDVTLREDAQSLNDVVVVGYGAVKKSDLTGSVASIKADELQIGRPLSFDRGLQGKVAGVQVTQNDGAPGAGINIQIRGVNSFGTNSQPLYVIDGVPLQVNNDASTPNGATSNSDNAVQTTNALNFLRPSDIESIEVLKDASATAIYGSRGANGVVIVTTKRGQSGQDRVDVAFRTGFDRVAKQIKVLDATTYASYLNEKVSNFNQYIAGGDTTQYFPRPFSGRIDPLTGLRSPTPADFVGHNTNWQDQIFRNGPVNEASVLFSGGGGDKGSFAISANYIKQGGIISNSNFEQGNLRLNVTRNVTKWLTFETNTQISRSLNKLVKTASANSEGNAGVIYSALRYAPTVPAGNDTLRLGSGAFLTPVDQLTTTNPLRYIQDVKNQNLVNSIFSSSSLVFNVLPGLQLRTRLGLNYYSSTRNVYYPRNTYEGGALMGVATVSGYNEFDVTSENIATYSRKFGEKHDLTAVAGFTYTNNQYNTSTTNAYGFLNDVLQDNNLGAATNRLLASGRSATTLLSYLGRINYNLLGRYLFTLTGRVDGASQFAANHKYAPFAAGAFAWRAIDEEFLKNSSVFSDLKVRLSYGSSGNQAIGAYQSLARLTPNNYVFGGQLVNGYYVSSLPSPDLTWETTYQGDAGVDLGFFENRLTLTVDVYDKQTKRLLQQLPLGPDTGYNSGQINAGQVQNRGLELSLSVRAVDGDKFKWTPSGNISFNRNKIIDLGLGETRPTAFSPRIATGPEVLPFILQAGQSLGRVYGYQEEGIFQNADEVKAHATQPGAAPGEIKYADLNGDGKIDSNDQHVIGNVNPRYVFGINNTFTYKGFDLTVFFQGSVGNDIINFTRVTSENLGTTRSNNITQYAYDNRWTPQNPGGTVRKAIYSDDVSFLFSNRFVEDGTYVRLKNATLGYNFDFKQYGLRSVRVYVSATNLVTWTHYLGYDPEVNAYGQNPALRGVDLGNYPTSRQFSAGVNVGF